MTRMCAQRTQAGNRACVTIPYDLWHSRCFALTSGMRDESPPMELPPMEPPPMELPPMEVAAKPA